MEGVLTGFAVILVVIAVGYGVGRLGVLGVDGEVTLSRLVFFVATPALLFTTLADADISAVLGPGLVASVVSVTVVATVFALFARLLWRRSWAETVVGALASSYVNAANLGIPIAVYVLGDASYAVPVLLLQLAVLTPLALSVLDGATRSSARSLGRVLAQPLLNPVTIACACGLAVGLTPLDVPALLMRPVELIGAVAVPVALIAFGMSMHGAPLPGGGDTARMVWLSVALKTLVQPAVAYVFAASALDLDGTPLLAATVTAALPTAQNVLVYAVRYDRATTLAREVVLLTTFVSAPVLLLIAALVS